MSELPLEPTPLILIVDDDRTMRSLLNLAMEEEGYRVIDICFQLSLDWQDIADSPPLPPRDNSLRQQSTVSTAITTNDSEQLISFARSQIYGQIEAQCGTVQSFFEFAQPLVES